jgi:hypothetical protein
VTQASLSTELGLAPRGPSSPAVARAPELPVFDPNEAERAVDFVRFVRLLVAWPMTTLGVLAFGAGLALGHAWFALAAAVVTTLIPVSLWDDMRLARALELLGRGNPEGAQEGLRRVATSSRRFGPQRQRACAALAALAWRRCDHEAALHWIQARRRLLGRSTAGSGTTEERWSTAASEVWLLALLGHAHEAQALLDRLEPAPHDDGRIVEITAHLLVAFARDDAEAVRPHLDAWTSVCETRDELGLASVALAWASSVCGRRDAAMTWAHRICDDRLRHVRAHAPRLHRWLESHRNRPGYARG